MVFPWLSMLNCRVLMCASRSLFTTGQHGGGGRLRAVPAHCGGEGQARREAHLQKEGVQAHRPQETLHGGGEPLLDGPGDAER